MARLASDITLYVPVVCSVIPRLYIIIALSVEAYILAASIILSLATPVIPETCSGVYFATPFLSSLNPSVRFFINSLSSSPSFRITCIIPFNRAMFVPGIRFNHTSAFSASCVFLGSPTISFVPFLIASFILSPTIGCASYGLAPITNSNSVSRI